jgi:hypothetical protein
MSSDTVIEIKIIRLACLRKAFRMEDIRITKMIALNCKADVELEVPSWDG